MKCLLSVVFFFRVSVNMTSIDQLDALPFPEGGSLSLSVDGKYLACIPNSNKSIVNIYSSKDAAPLKTIHVPGYDKLDHTSSSLQVTCVWSAQNVVYIVSSWGHFYSASSSSDWEVKPVPNFNPKNCGSRNYHRIALQRDLAVIASDCELLVWSGGNRLGILPFSRPDHVFSMEIHPSGSFVALCLRTAGSVAIVALNGSNPELTCHLGRTPRDVTEDEFQTPAELNDDDETLNSFPVMLNQVVLRNPPVACCWSKYGDNLVVASSEELLSIWSIPSSTISTVSLSDEGGKIFIRNAKFVNDSLVAVAVDNPHRILFVDVDEGVLYSSDENATIEGGSSKNSSMDFSINKNGSNVVIFRPCLSNKTINRWVLAL